MTQELFELFFSQEEKIRRKNLNFLNFFFPGGKKFRRKNLNFLNFWTFELFDLFHLQFISLLKWKRSKSSKSSGGTPGSFFLSPKKFEKFKKSSWISWCILSPRFWWGKLLPYKAIFFGGCSVVRPILRYGTLFVGWSYYLEASFHQTCPYQFISTTHSHSCSLQLVWRNAIPGFCPCSKPKKNFFQFYRSHPWLLSLPSQALLPAISGKKWAVSSAVAFLGFTTCNLWKKMGSK